MTTALKTVSVSAVELEQQMIKLYQGWKDATRGAYAVRYSHPEWFLSQLGTHRDFYLDQVESLHGAVITWCSHHRNQHESEQVGFWLYRRAGLYRAAVLNVDPLEARRHRNVDVRTVQALAGAEKRHRVKL